MKKNKELTKQDWDEKYRVYVRKYLEQQEKMIRRGMVMSGNRSSMYNRSLFESMYRETKDALLQDMENGERGSVGNVYQYMVREQAYPYNQRKLTRIKKAFKEMGLDYVKIDYKSSYEDIWNQVKREDWKLIDEYYNQLRVDGMSQPEAKKFISRWYFGSK